MSVTPKIVEKSPRSASVSTVSHWFKCRNQKRHNCDCNAGDRSHPPDVSVKRFPGCSIPLNSTNGGGNGHHKKCAGKPSQAIHHSSITPLRPGKQSAHQLLSGSVRTNVTAIKVAPR